jgi:hypothetical protein
LRLQKDFRAVSTLLTILLILAAAILGGIISYMWAIAPFFATPTKVNLSITGANFPLYHANYFVVTVLNPSYSSSGTNITSISLTTPNGTNVLNVTDSDPALPVFLNIGASVSIQCNLNWGAYAGENLTVTVTPQTGIGATFTVTPSFVQLTATAYFDPSETVGSFLMIVQNNASSAINLTLTGVSIDGTDILDFSTTLPKILGIGNSTTFTCFFDWQGHVNPDVVVQTQEGYDAEVIGQVNASVTLQITNLQFNQANSDSINVTLLNSPSSTLSVDVANITIAYGTNSTDVINGTLSSPALPYTLDVNSSVTLECVWNWSSESYRNMTISVTAFTSQGFASQTVTYTTPDEVAAQVDQTEFDLADTGHFNVTVTNLPCSLYSINVTEIYIENNEINISQPLVAIGEQAVFVCAFNWSAYVRHEVNITAYATYENGSLVLPFLANVTYYEIMSVKFSTFSLGNPYMNVTVINSPFSGTSADITQIFVQTENGNQTIDGTISYPQISPQYQLAAGTEQTITCPWNWVSYSGQDVTVIVQTADGFQAALTLII